MPVPAPSSVPTPNPSPECPGDESLYKIQLSDNHADGWEGASFEIHDTNGAVAASGTLSDGGAGMQYVCLPDGDYELEFTAPAGWGDDADDDEESCATVVGPNGGSPTPFVAELMFFGGFRRLFKEAI